jgi:hypothetical protein
MDEPDSKGPAHELRRWELSPERRGDLKLVLQYDPDVDAADEREGSLQLLLPPEAALHLADELSRQAHRSLAQQGRSAPSPGRPDRRR